MNRKEYREAAFSLLFSYDFRSDEIPEDFYISYLSENEIKDDLYLKKVFFGVINQKEKIDDIISKNLSNWNIQRLSKVTLVILRLAIYEMSECDDIPFVVSINEAVELAKKFDEQSSSKFVNGILNSAAASLGLK